MRLTVGTRGSPLALEQTRRVTEALRRRHPQLEIVVKQVRTMGDDAPDAPLATMPRGLFAKELEIALGRGEIDLAVHSFKDLPAQLTPGFIIAAITEREDARDALVAPGYASLDALPPGARLGTSSPRRAAQLRAYRPDLLVLPIRGNVGTRIAKADRKAYDGVVLAAAGIHRLGLAGKISAYLDPEWFVPEPGQGALAVQARADDARSQGLAAVLDHGPTRTAVTAEVAVLEALGGGCKTPIAAHAQLRGGTLSLWGMVADADGRRVVRATAQGPAQEPAQLGRELAARLRALGAEALLGLGAP